LVRGRLWFLAFRSLPDPRSSILALSLARARCDCSADRGLDLYRLVKPGTGDFGIDLDCRDFDSLRLPCLVASGSGIKSV
jgi:hypothetical protein